MLVLVENYILWVSEQGETALMHYTVVRLLEIQMLSLKGSFREQT
jgi:hypothetical protein